MESRMITTHWLDAFPAVLDVHLDKVINLFSGISVEGDKSADLGSY